MTVAGPTPAYPYAYGGLVGAGIGGLLGGKDRRGTAIGSAVGTALGALIEAKAHRVARAVLYRADEDGGGFGVFSYLIAAQKDPASPAGQRLRAAIDAYARQAPYCRLDKIDPSRIDIFYVPLTSTRPADADSTLCKGEDAVAALLFHDYDTARANALADKAGLDGQGPYLVASLKPLSTLGDEDRQNLLIWELSTVEPGLVRLMVDEYITSANRPESWNKASLRKWVLDLRNWIAIASQGWSISREAAATAIKGPQ